MRAFEQSVLNLTAPLILGYIALLGLGYLLNDFRQWRHRHPMRHAPIAVDGHVEQPEEVPRSRSLLPRRKLQSHHWLRRTIAAAAHRRRHPRDL